MGDLIKAPMVCVYICSADYCNNLSVSGNSVLLLSKEALINSSMNSQSKKGIKCDFIPFFIFNGLSAIENGGTSMCRGNSELVRVFLK